jgi:hypothetical protein
MFTSGPAGSAEYATSEVEMVSLLDEIDQVVSLMAAGLYYLLCYP